MQSTGVNGYSRCVVKPRFVVKKKLRQITVYGKGLIQREMSGLNYPVQLATGSFSSLSLNEPKSAIKLSSNNKERELNDNYAEVYSIIKTVEYLEKAYFRNACTAEEYTPACSDLIAQFKTALKYTPSDFNLDKFVENFRVDCKAAIERLKIGVPATIEHKSHSTTSGSEARNIAETVQHFITAMDSLKLGMTAVDEIQPILVDILSSLNSISSLPDFSGKDKIGDWLKIMSGMHAGDSLNSNQVRQLQFDLETAYSAFHKSLSK